MSTVFFGLGMLLLFLGLHPFTTYPLSLVAIRALRRRPIMAQPGAKPSFAVCVCAYNEERVIEDKIRNLLDLRRAIPGLQILVYVDAASDRTAEILRQHENEITLHVSPERHGKTYGMNLLVDMCSADIIVFTDANVFIEPKTLPHLADYFADPDVGCVCGHLVYLNKDDTPTAGVGALYWRYEEWIKQLEADTGSAMGADGSIFAIRRALHHKTPDRLFDDMFVSMSILCDGKRIVRAGNVMAYERGATSSSEEYDRKVRIACQSFNVHRELWPRLKRLGALDMYKYISHKFLRWNSIWELLAAALFIDAWLLSSGHAVIAVVLPVAGFGALAAGRFMKLPVLSALWEVYAAFWATGVGVLRSMRGVYFQTWTPAESIREAIVVPDKPG